VTDKILIYDDIPERAEAWHERLIALPPVNAAFIVEQLDNEEFRQILGELEERRRAARRSVDSARAPQKCRFDDADLLVVDYDLLEFGTDSYVTGEGVAYLARCYSRCGPVVTLNQYVKSGFDLTLRGHPGSFADLNIEGGQLGNPGLWSQPFRGFRPWSWPLLPWSVEAMRERAAELVGHLDEPILTFLGFPREAIESLPRSTQEFLAADAPVEEVTFRAFVDQSGSGLRPRDKVAGDEAYAHIAAARVGKWLEDVVLPGQDILVDAPHLAARFPSLLAGDPTDPAAWDATATLSPADSGRRGQEWTSGLREELLEGARFPRTYWLSRPAFFWPVVAQNSAIPEVGDPWSAFRTDLVFCEDVSRFLPRAACREFVADLPSPFVRRYVVDPESQVARELGFGREALTVSENGEGATPVEYQPALRFSL
jgi:hypothetical protein